MAKGQKRKARESKKAKGAKAKGKTISEYKKAQLAAGAK